MNHRAPAKANSYPVQQREEPQRSRRAPFPIVGVGASAGGLEAFTQLLKALPSRTGMAYVLVQHLDPCMLFHPTWTWSSHREYCG